MALGLFSECPPCLDPGMRAPWFHMTLGLCKMERKIWDILFLKEASGHGHQAPFSCV